MLSCCCLCGASHGTVGVCDADAPVVWVKMPPNPFRTWVRMCVPCADARFRAHPDQVQHRSHVDPGF